jgi:flagellar biosynthetic protein FliR
MSLAAFSAWLAAVLLFAVRIGVAIGLAPGWSSYGVPALLRVVLMLALSALAAGALPADEAPAWPLELPSALVAAIGAEVVVGALLGLGLRVALAAFALAGRLLDVQVGFAIGSLFDPVAQSGANVLGALLGLLGVLLFFATDAHLAMVRLVVESGRAFPLGRWPELDDPARPLFAAGALFSLGLALAAPVALALLATDLALGAAARNLPQLNLLVLGMPVRAAVGAFVLALSVAGWSPVIGRLFALSGELLGARR